MDDFGLPPSQFHLTRSGRERADELIKAGWFASQPAAAKFGFAVALRNGFDLDALPVLDKLGSDHGGGTHSLSAVDPDYEMDRILRTLVPEYATASRKDTYNLIMKVSDLGLQTLYDSYSSGNKITTFID